MSKIVIAGAGRIPREELGLIALEKLKREFTFSSKDYMTGKERLVEAFRTSDSWIEIPRLSALKFASAHGIEIDDRTREGIPLATPFKFRGEIKLWKAQEACVRDFIDEVSRRRFGGIIQSGPGTGKTVMGLWLAAHFQMKTMILVHKEFLMDQWRKRIHEYLIAPGGFPLTVGKVQGPKCDWEEHPVVLGMIESVLSGKYPAEMYESFGTIIVDEAHRTGAEEWCKAIPWFPARLRIGLTATPRRKDGCERLFFESIGPVVAKTEGYLLAPKVKKIEFECPLPMHGFRFKAPQGDPKLYRSNVISWLCKQTKRNEVIVKNIVDAAKAGRTVLVLTDRREHVKELQDWVDKVSLGAGLMLKTGRYMGLESRKELEYAEKEANVLFGTWAMAEEGLDIPRLDTLVMATPRSDVEQAVGRILRLHPGKHGPIVVDVVDRMFPEFERAFQSRKKTYELLQKKQLDNN